MIEANAGIVEQLLIESKVDWQLSDVRQSERAFLGAADDHVAEVARVRRQLDVVERDIDTVDAHLSLTG